MTVIGVNPASVQTYGLAAQREFDAIRSQLVALVEDVAEVHWTGPHAQAFKTRTGQLAAAFANQVITGLAAMADVVRTSTSGIAQALGGAPLALHVSGAPITVPPFAAPDRSEVDTAALEALGLAVDRRIDAVGAALATHARALVATEWSGNAKSLAVISVQRFTSTALGQAAEARATLHAAITDQLRSVVTADR